MIDTPPAQALRNLIASQTLGVLATQGEGGPHASLVGFAPTDRMRGLLFATPRGTHKFANLAITPQAALLIDSRNADAAVAATATGPCVEVRGPERERYARELVERMPSLERFLARADCALMRMNVEAWRLVTSVDDAVTVRMES